MFPLLLLLELAVVGEHVVLLQAVPVGGPAQVVVGRCWRSLPPPGRARHLGRVRPWPVPRRGVVRWDLGVLVSSLLGRGRVGRSDSGARMWTPASCWSTSCDPLLTLPHLVVPTVRLRRQRVTFSLLQEGVASSSVLRALPLLLPLCAPILKPNLKKINRTKQNKTKRRQTKPTN